MTVLTWAEKHYDIGLDRGVFYPRQGSGVVWDGLISVEEINDSDGYSRYIDGVKTYQKHTRSGTAGIIEAYTYPDGFFADVLTQARSESFGISYRVRNEENYS